MRNQSNATRAARLARLSERNRAALTYLHRAAQAISDDEVEHAEACMANAVRHLRPSQRLSTGLAKLADFFRLPPRVGPAPWKVRSQL
jgi:hypothetical protein